MDQLTADITNLLFGASYSNVLQKEKENVLARQQEPTPDGQTSIFPPILFILVLEGVCVCVGIEPSAAGLSRSISCRLQNTISPRSSEPKPEQWLAFTEDALILGPPCSAVLLEYWSGPLPET